MISKSKKQKEIQLRQWCVEQARGGCLGRDLQEVLKEAEMIYNWMTGKSKKPSYIGAPDQPTDNYDSLSIDCPKWSPIRLKDVQQNPREDEQISDTPLKPL